jgi:ubiquinone biosynthesis protein
VVLPRIFLLLILSIALGVRADSRRPLYLSFEQRLAVSYILLAAGEKPSIQKTLLEKMAAEFQRQIEAGHRDVEVSSFEEFLAAYRGEWPNSNSLENDIKLISQSEPRGIPHFFSSNAGLDKKIKAFLKDQNSRIIEKYGVLLPAAGAKALNAGDELIEDEFKKVADIGRRLLKKSAKVGPNDGFRMFISFAIGEYFSNLSLKSKKQIISQLLGENLNAGMAENFEIMVLNSGPQFQKLLQVVAREAGLNDELLTIFKRLESRARPVPPAVVAEIIGKEKNNYNFTEYDLKPLGVGTMAQVHKGKLMTEQGERAVVIRLLKPEIEERVEEDDQILQRLAPRIDLMPELRQAGFPKVTPLAEELTETVREELDQNATSARQVRGQVYNQVRGKISIYVPEVFAPQSEESQLLVQEQIRGKPLDQVPEVKKEVVQRLAEVWLEELLFKTGFFHSDLHQGNFLVDKDDTITVNLLDFGMGGELSEKQRQYFILLAVGGDANRAKLIAEGLYGLSKNSGNQIRKDDIEDLVNAKVAKLKAANAVMTPDRWLAWAMNAGLRYSSTIVGVSRGITIIDKLLKDAQIEKSALQLSRELAKKNKWEILQTLRNSESFQLSDYFFIGQRAFARTTNYDRSPLEEMRMCRSILLVK